MTIALLAMDLGAQTATRDLVLHDFQEARPLAKKPAAAARPAAPGVRKLS